MDPNDAAIVYAAGFGGIWRSDDGGVTWNGITNLPDDRRIGYEAVAADPVQSGHILAGKSNIAESSDGGSSWSLRWDPEAFLELGLPEEAIRGTSPTSIVFAPSDPSTVYVGFGDESCAMGHEPSCARPGPGIIVSYDGGASWQRAVDSDMEDLSVFDIAVDAANASVVYAGTGVGLYRTTDGGEDWTAIAGLPQGMPVHAVAVSPNDSQSILVGVERQAMFRSADGGASWQRVSAGMEPNSAIHDIVFDPANPDVVYASDVSSGVYRSMNGGETWIKINDGLRNRAAMGLAISSDGKHVYVGIRNDGVYRLDLDGQPPEAAAVAGQ